MQFEGPWTHRSVSANGSRFHVVEAGTGPLILLLHGFPEFWWSWRHQIVDLADAGYRAVAVDLRGYGGSDKPPRGYDGYTLASDVAGLIRALGERDAMLVGHDWGGFLAWTAAAFHPRMVRRIAVLGMPHPLRLRTALATDPRGQLAASRYLFAFQAPRYEHVITRDGAELHRRADAPLDRAAVAWHPRVRRVRGDLPYRDADPAGRRSARWSTTAGRCARSPGRAAGASSSCCNARSTRRRLQLHGGLDTCLLPRTAQGSGRYVSGKYEWQLLPGVGHFLQSEAPERVTGELIRFAKEG